MTGIHALARATHSSICARSALASALNARRHSVGYVSGSDPRSGRLALNAFPALTLENSQPCHRAESTRDNLFATAGFPPRPYFHSPSIPIRQAARHSSGTDPDVQKLTSANYDESRFGSRPTN